MKYFIIIVTILFMIIFPLIVIAGLRTYYIDMSNGIILLSILVFTMSFSIFLVTLKMEYERRTVSHFRRYRRNLNGVTLEDEEHSAALTPEEEDPANAPPLYDELYPEKTSLQPFNTLYTVSSTPPYETNLFVNPFSENMGNASSHLQRVDGDESVSLPIEQDEDGLPSYSEALRMSQQKM